MPVSEADSDDSVGVRSWVSDPADPMCICTTGARTPLGRTLLASTAAVRGAISAASVEFDFVDQAGEPANVARDPDMGLDVALGERMAILAELALAEAIAPLVALTGAMSVQSYIAVPAPRPGVPPDLPGILATSLHATLEGSRRMPEYVARGNAGGVIALISAAEAIAEGHVDACLVAAVDSYQCGETLRWLDTTGRLLSPVNRDGFIPSEAAAAVLVARRSTAARVGLPALADVVSIAAAVEPRIGTGQVCLGHGLTAAIGGACGALRATGERASATFCDLNGQRYRSEEFAYALLRVQEAFVDAHDYQCPADCWGDVGAASGVLLAALAARSCHFGSESGPLPLVWVSSEEGERAALLLRVSAGQAMQ